MVRRCVLVVLLLLLGAGLSVATDWRLVVASDDPNVRNVPTMVLYEATGKVKKTDRITSITFSAAADVKPNCLVSLDPSSGKISVPLGPDVQVFKGKLLIAGSKPSRRVIPAYLKIDVPLPVAPPQSAGASVIQPIIQQASNLPWIYIGSAVAIFMAFMYFMNRRSQQFTTTMTKEAKNLYVETINRITDRLEKIEASQERLVKNPPVIRSFRSQIADFELRLGRIEKVAIESKDELAKAASEFNQASLRDAGLSTKLDAAKAESEKIHAQVRQESAALLAELKLLAKTHAEAQAKLGTLDGIQAALKQSVENGAKVEAKLAAQETLLAKDRSHQISQLQAIGSEISDLKANQGKLANVPAEVAEVSAQLAKLPQFFDAIRASIPSMDTVEQKLEQLALLDAAFAKLDELSAKLDGLAEIKTGLAALPSHFPKLDENLARSQDFDKLANRLDALTEIQSSLEALPSHFSKLDDGLVKAQDIDRLSAQLEALSEMKTTLDTLPSHFSKLDDSLVKSHDIEKLAARLEALNEIKSSLDTLPSQFPKLDDNLIKSHEFEKLSAQLDALNEIKSSLDALPAQMPKGKSADLEKISAQLDSLGDIKSRLDALPTQIPNFGGDLAQIQDSLQKQFESLTGKIDASGANIADLIVSTSLASQEEAGDNSPEAAESKKPKKKTKAEPEAQSEQPPKVEAKEVVYRYPKDTNSENGEFSFNNAIRQMEQEETAKGQEEPAPAASFRGHSTFQLGDLPEKLETFEDSGPDVVLPTLKVDTSKASPDEEEKAVKLVLEQLTSKKTSTKTHNHKDEEAAAHMGHWNGYAGSSSRTWSSQSSRALQLVEFEGELKPLTPIETAPVADKIGAIIFGFGRVLYACGNRVHGFWPGREGRSVTMDHPIPADDWRLAVKGQNLFVAEQKKVKIASIQGWFVLEQFSGEYHDQLLTEGRWMGLRHEKGAAVVDFRDLRGQMCSEGVNLRMSPDGAQLCAGGDRFYAGSWDGQLVEISEHGVDAFRGCPPSAQLVHLCYADGGPLAVYRIDGSLHAYHFGDELKAANLKINAFAAKPVVLGNKLYLADLDEAKLVSLDLRTMEVQTMPAFDGVSLIRRMVGVQHKGQHNLIAITSDSGKKGGRLLNIDAKSGKEVSFGPVGPADVNLICADHHLVFATSNQYQNVIRVLEPFTRLAAAA